MHGSIDASDGGVLLAAAVALNYLDRLFINEA